MFSGFRVSSLRCQSHRCANHVCVFTCIAGAVIPVAPTEDSLPTADAPALRSVPCREVHLGLACAHQDSRENYGHGHCLSDHVKLRMYALQRTVPQR